MTKDNPFKDVESLRRGAEVVAFSQAKTNNPVKSATKSRRFAFVPLDGNWGYRAMKLAGAGGGIVLHALYIQRTTGKGGVPITAEVLRRCGISRPARTRTLQRLVNAGLASVRYRGQRRGCPLLTLHLPPGM
jgi:hypothetical protein